MSAVENALDPISELFEAAVTGGHPLASLRDGFRLLTRAFDVMVEAHESRAPYRTAGSLGRLMSALLFVGPSIASCLPAYAAREAAIKVGHLVLLLDQSPVLILEHQASGVLDTYRSALSELTLALESAPMFSRAGAFAPSAPSTGALH